MLIVPERAGPANPLGGSPARPNGSARRFELVEGTSSKFWEVALSGVAVTVRYGRIGTGGQEKTKQFADEASALRHLEALVREKSANGYVET